MSKIHTSSCFPRNASGVAEDVRLDRFAVSNFFISFINVPRFLSMFSRSDEREMIQPALVFSILALSTFLKSNDLELGAPGRKQARRCYYLQVTMWNCTDSRTFIVQLRDEAQAHMEASFNAGWLSLGLAQAALVRYMNLPLPMSDTS